MSSILERLFEHNNWANRRIFEACAVLSDEQLDAEPQSATQGSIRSTLAHLTAAQQGYLRLLTLPLEERQERVPAPPFAELERAAEQSGEAMLTMVRDGSGTPTAGWVQTRDGYHVEKWVVLVQVINHAAEHREQIKSMLTAIGVEPPSLDGWEYGEFTGALVPIEPGANSSS